MSPAPLSTPVAFCVFNRPELTDLVFAEIRRARPPQLLVVGDGPRAEHPDDADRVARVREIVEQVDWPCEVLTNFAATNLGCRRRIATGLDWVFSQVPEAIVLEDDTVPDPTFFRFCEELLERYRTDERLHMISGSSLLERPPSGDQSYRFSRWCHIWGWATWARAWAHYDVEMRRWPQLRDTDWLERRLAGIADAALLRRLFDEVHAGRVDTWDFQWTFAAWLHDAVCVKPRLNLVTNLGYGAVASHERDLHHPAASLPRHAMRFPLVHPAGVDLHDAVDRAELRGTRPDHFHPDELVLGVALGLDVAVVRAFLASLRSGGYRGDVALFVDPALRRALRGDPLAAGVSLVRAHQWLPFRFGLLARPRFMRRVWGPVGTAAWRVIGAAARMRIGVRARAWLHLRLATTVYPPMDSRFARYRDFLERHPHRRILLTDVRDVVFQADPFTQMERRGLSVSLETPSYTLGSEPHNARWIERVLGREALSRLADCRVSCVGVTGGDAQSVAAYLRQMEDELRLIPPAAAGCAGSDTAVHNMLLWTGRLGEIHELEPLGSPVATLNGIDAADLRFDDAGRLLNRDGEPPSVLHQYDRVSGLAGRLSCLGDRG